ncbi:MAG: response regulator [Planctomycetaceae bacterium]|nr:response regulator [Planctomycetales bacterium]MCB9925805.1 response regulator [Planctomycetaceae bacterium]
MSLTALVVDDEPHIRRVAELAIRATGCKVISACNGEQAWEEIQVNCPDILVSDVQMPKIDGIELVRMIRATPAIANLPVILLTAKGFELHQDDSEQTRACEIICKPFSPAALSRRVHQILASRLARTASTV